VSIANRVQLVRAVWLGTARVRPEHAKVPALNVRTSVSAETNQPSNGGWPGRTRKSALCNSC